MEKDKKTDKTEKKPSSKTFLFKNFISLEQLGKGTYGSVYKAQRGSDIVAIKKIKLDVDTEGIPSTVLREIAILKKMKHPNIVR
jgi:serine/threonine protein kinase